MTKKGEIEEKKVDEVELLQIMYTHNPWWETGRVSETKALPFKRRDFRKIVEEIEDREIKAIVGPRRVGKTTIIYQLIEYIIERKSPTKTLYITLDDPYLGITTETMKRILEQYSEVVLKEPLADLKERVYIFLDEVQTLKKWELVLKRWYDLGYNMKFYLSGSSSTHHRASDVHARSYDCSSHRPEPAGSADHGFTASSYRRTHWIPVSQTA